MNREELILKDFKDRLDSITIQEKFSRLYVNQDNNFKKIFAYFHQAFNGLFEFMNQKNNINKHYNAAESRQLLDLMDEFEELHYSLKEVGTEVILVDSYYAAMQYCRGFLTTSGGSAIPEDYIPILILKYDPILELANKTIFIPQLNQTNQLNMVGQGAFSIVQKYKDQYYNKFFAVKQAKNNLDERELVRFKREFEILKSLSFPYILEVYGYDNQKNSYTMEYCDCTLDEYITKNNQSLHFENRKKLALQFLYGINYLHQKKYLHRDISYRNILLKRYDYNALLVKLSDFGLAKEDSSIFTKSDTEIKGTIIDPCLDKFKNYNQQNEIYSVGFILLFIFTGKKNLNSERSGIYEIVNKCTDRDMLKRYKSVSEIIVEVDKLQPEGSNSIK